MMRFSLRLKVLLTPWITAPVSTGVVSWNGAEMNELETPAPQNPIKGNSGGTSRYTWPTTSKRFSDMKP
jgi:hypothetical protein